MGKRPRPDPTSRASVLADHLTRFFNAAFGRRLGITGPSRALHDAITSAIENGYTEDEMRIAFWVARCQEGEAWLKTELQKRLPPEICLRHHGGMNRTTGKPAVRWLDNLVEQAGEINPALAGAVLRGLPEDMVDDEKKLLERYEIPFNE